MWCKKYFYLVNIWEDGSPVILTDNLMIVTKFGGVGEVWHKNIQRLQIWCFTENKQIRNEYFVVSTNQQQVLYCVNQSEVSIILCQPIRGQ